jgi:hypothetical protein
LKSKENIGVMAFISPSSIASLASRSQYIDSHSYELKSALQEMEGYESIAMMFRSIGRELPPKERPETANSFTGKENYLLCGYLNYFLTGKNSSLGRMDYKTLPHVWFEKLVYRHKQPDYLFRIIQFRKETTEGIVERTAFGIAARSGTLLRRIVSELTMQGAGDSFFHDLEYGAPELPE